MVRYSLKLRSFVQYFYVLGKFIFLDFPSIWNEFIEIVSGRIIFNQLNCVNKNLDIKGFLYYKSSNVIGINHFCPRNLLSSAHVSLPSLSSPLKSYHCATIGQYLGKYVFVRRETRFGKVAWETNPNLLNKFSLKIACAYLNTQESSPSGTPLKRLQDGCIIKRARFASVAVVPTKIVSLCNVFAISRQIRVCTTKFWKVPWHTYLNLFACAYVNTQESSQSGTPLKRLQDGNVFYIILRYSMNLRSLVQYLFVLGKFIFLDFPSIWNEFIEILSGRYEMWIKSSTY
ncbi:hypothetical protein T03_9908 [Trichinella britovi]|uniref:Uncharacterized protein n=1 Tax=Trichinella britovi TaxID=45882 RepID=A0A0V1CZZ0_TRIBR|nr:hypothetical protein T03_9908 [Trichinella britovi]